MTVVRRLAFGRKKKGPAMPGPLLRLYNQTESGGREPLRAALPPKNRACVFPTHTAQALAVGLTTCMPKTCTWT